MNQWKKCLKCWIPDSKTNKKKPMASIQSSRENEDSNGSTRIHYHEVASSSSSSSHGPYVRSLPPSITPPSTTPRLIDNTLNDTNPDHFPAAANVDYIQLDECFSGSGGGPKLKNRTLQLAEKDFKMLDLVPPSPCSLVDNFSLCSAAAAAISSRDVVHPPPPPMMTYKRNTRMVQGQSSLPHGLERSGSGSPYSSQKIQSLRKISNGCCSAEIQNDMKKNNTVATAAAVAGNIYGFQRPPCSSVSSESVSEPGCSGMALQSSRAATPERAVCLHYSNFDATCNDDDNNDEAKAPRMPAPRPPVYDPEIKPHILDTDKNASHSLRILHMTPPPPLQTKTTKGPRYINATDENNHHPIKNTSSQSDEISSYSSSSSANHNPPSIPEDRERYYNLPIPSNSPASKKKSSSQKKRFSHQTIPHTNSLTFDGGVALPVRRYNNNNYNTTDDSSSSNDEDDGNIRNNNSDRSLNRRNRNPSMNLQFIPPPLLQRSSDDVQYTQLNLTPPATADFALQRNFFTSLPPPPPAPCMEVKYTQLDLENHHHHNRYNSHHGRGRADGPCILQGGGNHRQNSNHVTTYMEIDQLRTIALSDTRKQLENNRNKTTQ